jgi:hypothetical protein
MITLLSCIVTTNNRNENDNDSVLAALFQEIGAFQSEVNNQTIIQALSQSLSNGSIAGQVGHLKIPTAIDESIKRLGQDIADAQVLGCETAEAKQLLLSAQVMFDVRTAMSGGDWEGVEGAIEQCEGLAVVKECMSEFNLIKDEVADRVAARHISEALASGK